MAVTAGQMREIERAAFRRGIAAGDLMDAAGAGVAARLLHHFPTAGTAVAYLGKGNNAGDAVVVLEHLKSAGWKVACRSAHPPIELSILTRERLRRLSILPTEAAFVPEALDPRPLVLLDGLLGIGARGELRPPLSELAAEMNQLRRGFGAITAAIDLPSGLDADSGVPAANGVMADLTLTLGVPKRGLLMDHSSASCGRLFLVPLNDLPPPSDTAPLLIGPETLEGLLPPRAHEFHKGDAGRVSVLAGSPGMEGAAWIASMGVLRGGAGLVRLFLDADASLPSPPPELMIDRSRDRLARWSAARHDAVVAGPGMTGSVESSAFFAALEQLEAPAVLDADALNLIAAHRRHDLLRPDFIITPHPGEFARLAPELEGMPRAEAAVAFVERHPCTLLLKGARTLVASPDRAPRINPTGHAGMASGGQGDLLAGVCAALLAQGLAPPDAASVGAWLCGRAAERALISGGRSEQSLLASDSLDQLGGAFHDWRQRLR